MVAARAHRPDLVLAVHHRRRAGEVFFEYSLLSDEAGGRGWLEERFGGVGLTNPDPLGYLEGLFKAVERNRDPPAERIRGIGTVLAGALMPKPLIDRLSMVAAGSGGSAPSLQILSDETWVPWELLRLPDRSATGGLFLAEAFALARWLHGTSWTPSLPMTRIGVVMPSGSRLAHGTIERESLLEFSTGAHRVESVPAQHGAVLEAFGSGRFDGWHFITHGEARGHNPDLWRIQLEADEYLTPFDLEGAARGLGGLRPLVYLSACHGARSAYSLTDLRGFAKSFLEAGAGAFIGAHWALPDKQSAEFARGFYAHFLADLPIGEALRKARLELRAAYPRDPTWLAFALFAPPLAVAAAPEDAALSLPVPGLAPPEVAPILGIPQLRWSSDMAPGGLLQAKYGVVPFHRRAAELADLHAWCAAEGSVQVRLYTGLGGMGKSRLALELSRQLRELGWISGLVAATADSSPLETASALAELDQPLLLVVDYAETRRGLLAPLLGGLLRRRKRSPIRVLLLARRQEEWWEDLKEAPEGVGDLLDGPATTAHVLGPLAASAADRTRTFLTAAEAFACKLDRQPPEAPPADLEASYFKVVLLLHMSALGAVDGVRLKGDRGVLDWILRREREFWVRQLKARGLPERLRHGIGQAMAAITLLGGLPRSDAVELIGRLRFFTGQHRDLVLEVAELLSETYPGARGIAAVEPDLLGEHLVDRELKDELVRREIFDIVLGSEDELIEPSRSPGKRGDVIDP